MQHPVKQILHELLLAKIIRNASGFCVASAPIDRLFGVGQFGLKDNPFDSALPKGNHPSADLEYSRHGIQPIPQVTNIVPKHVPVINANLPHNGQDSAAGSQRLAKIFHGF